MSISVLTTKLNTLPELECLIMKVVHGNTLPRGIFYKYDSEMLHLVKDMRKQDSHPFVAWVLNQFGPNLTQLRMAIDHLVELGLMTAELETPEMAACHGFNSGKGPPECMRFYRLTSRGVAMVKNAGD